MADQSIKDIWFSAIGRASNYQTMVYYAGTGQDTFEFNFSGGYINKEDIKAFMVDDVNRERVDLTLTFTNTNTVKTNRVVPKGWTICIYRDTPKSMPLAKFVDGAIINATNLDRNAKQAVFSVSEMVDRFDSTVEQVDSALVQVAAALKASEEAVETANAADAKADQAIVTANGAVQTANAASSKADTAIKTANAATTTAQGAVKTANEAKETADGLNAQIIQANATADKALSTANGIDAKATKALADAEAAVKTANTALTTANGIDAKATQAQKDAAEALKAVGVAKGLTDRVLELPTGNMHVDWRGMHKMVGVQIKDAANSTQIFQLSSFTYQDGARVAGYIMPNGATSAGAYHYDMIDNTTTGKLTRFNTAVQCNDFLDVYKTTRLRGAITADSTLNVAAAARFNSTLRTASEIVTTGPSIKFDLNGRRHLWWKAGNDTADFVMYKDPNEPIVFAHQGTGGSASFDFSPQGNLVLRSDAGGSIGGLGNLEFEPRNGARYTHWMRQSGDANGTNWVFGIGGSEQVNFQYRETGGNVAIFQNEIYANGKVRGSVLEGNEARIGPSGLMLGDGNLSGAIWSSMGYQYASLAVADALAKAQDAQVNRVQWVRWGATNNFGAVGGEKWVDAGWVMIGMNSTGGQQNASINIIGGRIQVYKDNGGWMDSVA